MGQYFVEMVGGPGKLRFFLQPAIAIVLGILHGVRDHRAGRPSYVIGLVGARGSRMQRLGEGLREILVPLTIAVLASCVFQYVIRSRVHVLFALVYAALFVALPYFAARGLANRLSSGGREASRGA